MILPKSSHWKAYAQPFLGDAREPEVRTFPLFILFETICPSQDVHFRLTRVAQKRICLLNKLPVILWTQERIRSRWEEYY